MLAYHSQQMFAAPIINAIFGESVRVVKAFRSYQLLLC